MIRFGKIRQYSREGKISMKCKSLFIFFFLFLIAGASFADNDPQKKQGMSPGTNMGKKWRIAYLESGSYDNYYKSLAALVQGLARLGWTEPAELPQNFAPKDAAGLWKWLSENIRSSYIDFVSDAYWSQEFNDAKRPGLRREILARIREKKDIDLIIVMGTKAGQDMAANEHSTPVLVCSTTNAHAAKIVKSVEYSGYDHVHATIDAGIHELQVRTFHDIVGFKRLGLVYRDSEVGRGTADIDSVEKVARERGFELIVCDLNTVIPGSPENERKEEKAVKCYESIAPHADAVYITRYAGGVTLESLPKILESMTRYKIPTFSQAGSQEVEHGVLFSISESRLNKMGEFYAQTIARIFNGERPGKISQIFTDPVKLAINLETAYKIAYDPNFKVLAIVDEIYEKNPKVK